MLRSLQRDDFFFAKINLRTFVLDVCSHIQKGIMCYEHIYMFDFEHQTIRGNKD